MNDEYILSMRMNDEGRLAEARSPSPAAGATPPPATLHDHPDDDVFEGPEKKLDVFFSLPPDAASSASPRGLLAAPRDAWPEVCSAAACTILHRQSNDHFDAYLLSESSLFVYPHKVVMKTCGSTTLILVLPKLLAIAGALGLELEHVHYSHYEYKFPHLQPFPHTSYDEERATLAQLLGDRVAAVHARVLGSEGSASGACWYALCTEAHPAKPTGKATPEPLAADALDGPGNDAVIELAMEGLSPAACAVFCGSHHAHGGARGKALAQSMSELSGIAALVKGAEVDDWAFEPCGYSMCDTPPATRTALHPSSSPSAHRHRCPLPGPPPRALPRVSPPSPPCRLARPPPTARRQPLCLCCLPLPSLRTPLLSPPPPLPLPPCRNAQDGPHYYTVHITPEAAFSYASFETTDPAFTSPSKIAAIVAAFSPTRVTVTMTTRTQRAAMLPPLALDGFVTAASDFASLSSAVSVDCRTYVRSLPPPKALATTTAHPVLGAAGATAETTRADTPHNADTPLDADVATSLSSADSQADTDSDTALLDEVGGTEVEALSSSDEGGEGEAAAKRPRPSVERSSCTDEPTADGTALSLESPTLCVA